MSKSNEIDALELSARDLGKILDLTDRQVRNLAQSGIVIPGNERGRYRLQPSARNYVRSLQEKQTPASAELDAERLRAVRLANAARERKLIPVEEAEGAIEEIVGIILAELSALPTVLTKDPNLRKQYEQQIDASRERAARKIQRRQARSA